METKKCNKCYKEKELKDFYDKKRSKVRKDGSTHHWVGKYSSCKACTDKWNNLSKEKYKEWYKDYRKENKEKISEKSKSHYVKNTLEWIKLITTKKELKCSSCGYDKTWAGLDFHHVDPREKETAIHKIMKSGVPTPEKWKEMEKELDKCVVLCATCHREEHMKYDYFEMLSAEKCVKAYKEK